MIFALEKVVTLFHCWHVEIEDTLKSCLLKIFSLSLLNISHNKINPRYIVKISFSPNIPSHIQSYPKLFRNHKRIRSMLKSERARILINFVALSPTLFFFLFFFYRCTIFIFNLNVSAAKYAATIFHDVSIINFRQFRAPLRISNKSRDKISQCWYNF